MSSFVWWMAQQATRETVSWAAKNPAETSLGFLLLANPATRGFTLDILRSLGWRSLQFSGRVSMDVARAAATRSSTMATLGRWGSNVWAFVKRHPVGTVVAIDAVAAATAIRLAQHEDTLTQQVQVRSVSQGIGSTGQPSLGSWSPF